MSELNPFKKISKFICFWMLVALFFPRGEIFAGITGKIAGRVIDASTGEPLPSASIIIEGTTMGAASDIDGYYFIINVPPGTYTLTASMVGFQKVQINEVNVSSDHTTKIDFSLNLADVEMGEIIIVARQENIKRDVSSSQIVANAEQIQSIPMVSDLNSYVNLQAGVDGNDIRAGGLDSRGYMVDGLISIDNRTNQPLVLTNMSTVQELTLVKGGFNAEYGNIRSGLINVITKDPDANRIRVYADLRFSPARQKHPGPSIFSEQNFYNRPFFDPGVAFVGTKTGSWDEAAQRSNLEFIGWNAVSEALKQDNDPNNDLTPQQAQDLFRWQRAMEGSGALGQRERSYGDLPDFKGDISISGGVPFIGEALGDLAFLASFSGDWQAYKFPTSLDYYNSNTSSLKLVSRFSSTMKLGVVASYNERRTIANSRVGGSDNGFVGSGNNGFETYVAWWPNAFVPFTIYNSMIGITFDHVLSNSTFYTVRISQVHIQNSARPWGPESYRDTTKNKGTIGPLSLDELPYGFQIRNKNSTTPIYDVAGSIYSSDAGGHRDYGSVNTLNVKFDLTSQIDNYNQIKTGVDFTYDDIYTHYENQGYMSMKLIGQKWKQYPFRLGAYIQDKLEFEGMIANIGVRIDYNNPNGDWVSLEDPYTYYLSGKYRTQFSNAPMEKAKGKVKISPRLGISHPIGENVKLYFSYGHFYSMPSTSNMYRLNWGDGLLGVTTLGNPSLDLPRTIAYELGVDWDIANEVLVHIAGYYRNIDAQINSIGYTNYTNTVNYTTYNNANYQDTRGFEVTIERNFGAWVRGLANYTFEVNTRGNSGMNHYYQDPTVQAQDMIENPNVSRDAIQPKANVVLQIFTPNNFGPEVMGFYPLSDWIISPKFEWKAGSMFTLNPENNILGIGVKDNIQWKDNWTLDLRISKRFNIDKIGIEFYADINNLFNQKLINSNSNGGFQNNDDKEDYYKSLRLPLYNDPRFDNVRDEAKGWYMPGNDVPGDVKSSDKPYINMPDIDFLTFSDLRYITLGLRVNL